jgi:hypothetical protein
LLKDKPFFNESKKNYSDGFHIHYPNLILDVVDRFLIFDESKKDIISSNIFDDLYESLVEPKKEIANESIFDSCVIKKNSWFMYGSGKKIGDKVNLYEIKYIFDFNVDEIEETQNNSELISLLAIRYDKQKDINYKSDISEIFGISDISNIFELFDTVIFPYKTLSEKPLRLIVDNVYKVYKC